MLGHLEEHGYLERVPDAADGRVRVIRLTPKGRRLQQRIHAEAREAQLRIEEILGARRFAQLQNALELLTAELAVSPTA